MNTVFEKLDQLAETITREQQQELRDRKLDCQGNLDNAIAHVHIGKKYARIDIGYSGRYMVVMGTGEVFGIKAYGVIHRGHSFGTLDTINQYRWGGYWAISKVIEVAQQPQD